MTSCFGGGLEALGFDRVAFAGDAFAGGADAFAFGAVFSAVFIDAFFKAGSARAFRAGVVAVTVAFLPMESAHIASADRITGTSIAQAACDGFVRKGIPQRTAAPCPRQSQTLVMMKSPVMFAICAYGAPK